MCQLELWYEWAAQRVKLFLGTYCQSHEPTRDAQRTTLYEWLECKCQTLKKAGAACEVSSKRLLPIDTADQVVRPDRALASAYGMSS